MKKLFALLLSATIALSLVGCSEGDDSEPVDTSTPSQEQGDDAVEESDSTASDMQINLDQYNAIEMGMSYDDVVDIIGFDGEELGTTASDDMTIQVYQWIGNGSIESMASITFLNDEVHSKAKVNLE